jgi:hypothetical protein
VSFDLDRISIIDRLVLSSSMIFSQNRTSLVHSVWQMARVSQVKSSGEMVDEVSSRVSFFSCLVRKNLNRGL